jgi:hypothetical protein
VLFVCDVTALRLLFRACLRLPVLCASYISIWACSSAFWTLLQALPFSLLYFFYSLTVADAAGPYSTLWRLLRVTSEYI